MALVINKSGHLCSGVVLCSNSCFYMQLEFVKVEKSNCELMKRYLGNL